MGDRVTGRARGFQPAFGSPHFLLFGLGQVVRITFTVEGAGVGVNIVGRLFAACPRHGSSAIVNEPRLGHAWVMTSGQ
jgi:hypothetical protein